MAANERKNVEGGEGNGSKQKSALEDNVKQKKAGAKIEKGANYEGGAALKHKSTLPKNEKHEELYLPHSERDGPYKLFSYRKTSGRIAQSFKLKPKENSYDYAKELAR